MSEVWYSITGETLTDMANAVRGKVGGNAPMTPREMASTLEALNITLQEKTVTPSETEQTVTADAEYYGLSGVTVKSAPLQAKTVTPGESEQTITPDSEYYGLSGVTVNAMLLQEKTVTPTSEQQIITADEGYCGLSSVTVKAVESSGEPVLPPGVGIYYIGTANSVLSVNFESSAVGTLTE